MTAQEFTTNTSAWLNAGFTVLELLLAKCALLIAAYFALVLLAKKKDKEMEAELEKLAIKQEEELKAIRERQDRHATRLTAVALAVPPPMGVQQVEIVNDEQHRVPTTEEPAPVNTARMDDQFNQPIP